MEKQRHEEKTGTAKITPAYNLSCKYILHTVGPIIRGWLTKKDKDLLTSCLEVVFNAFKDTDHNIYRKLLGANGKTEK